MTDTEPRPAKVYKRGVRVDVPCAWLTAGWWDRLTMYERGVYVSALMWSQQQQLDGAVPNEALRFIDGDTAEVRRALDSICKKTGRLEQVLNGWEFVGWESLQEQSTSEGIATFRERKRLNQAEKRGRDRDRKQASVTGDVAGDVGKETPGNAT